MTVRNSVHGFGSSEGPLHGGWKAGLGVVCSFVLVLALVAAQVFAPAGNGATAAASAPVRTISIDFQAGSSSFVVIAGSRHVAGTFPKGFLPVADANGVAVPLRSFFEAAGGTVRFEKAQNTVYFALGPMTGAYEFRNATLVNQKFTASTRRDLLHRSGKAQTLYVTYDILKSIVADAGGSASCTTTAKRSLITLRVPAALKDCLGFQHDTFPARAGKMRLVTLEPNLAEDCFAIGQGKNIIAVADSTDYPKEATKIPSIGAFNSPSLEKLLALSPDLILVTDGTPMAVVNQLKKLGRPVYADDPKTILQTADAIRELGIVLGVPDRGFETALSMRETVAGIVGTAHSLPRSPSVYVEIWNSPLTSAGKGTYVSDIITTAGGHNIGDETDSEWPVLSEEFVIKHNPDIIIVGSGMGVSDVTGRASFAGITAVKDGHVYEINGDYIYRACPRMIRGLEQIADIIRHAVRP